MKWPWSPPVSESVPLRGPAAIRFVVKVDGTAQYFGPEMGANDYYVQALDQWGSEHVTIQRAGRCS